MLAHDVLYHRTLPGGGFVAVDTRPVDARPADGGTAGHPGQHQARLWVERRADPTRRTGHTPPVIAQATGDGAEAAAAELRAIAADNVRLALAMRRWAQARRAVS